jgi:hypothetical protein
MRNPKTEIKNIKRHSHFRVLLCRFESLLQLRLVKLDRLRFWDVLVAQDAHVVLCLHQPLVRVLCLVVLGLRLLDLLKGSELVGTDLLCFGQLGLMCGGDGCGGGDDQRRRWWW